jgi:hypothetical protein
VDRGAQGAGEQRIHHSHETSQQYGHLFSYTV